MPPHYMRWSQPHVAGSTPTIKNHTATLVDNQLLIFGGYDGRRNHSTVHLFDCDTYTWRPCTNIGGKAPQGRNGHTATLAERKIFIIGGWLGSGPLAASDMHVLHINAPAGSMGAAASAGPASTMSSGASGAGSSGSSGASASPSMSWDEPPVQGKPPGPCNMHTADYLAHLRQVLVFRGGDGREYLNDLHALDVDTYVWHEVRVHGATPLQRANHSSSVFGVHLFIFGGWDGQKRLNDVHMLNTETMVWSEPTVYGSLPHPRAGMTFTRLRDRLYLFGGSGPSAKCFNDLQVTHTPTHNRWRHHRWWHHRCGTIGVTPSVSQQRGWGARPLATRNLGPSDAPSRSEHSTRDRPRITRHASRVSRLAPVRRGPARSRLIGRSSVLPLPIVAPSW